MKHKRRKARYRVDANHARYKPVWCDIHWRAYTINEDCPECEANLTERLKQIRDVTA